MARCLRGTARAEPPLRPAQELQGVMALPLCAACILRAQIRALRADCGRGGFLDKTVVLLVYVGSEYEEWR